ncbi:uncharacterized protein LOC124356985 isoform X2 [Homalodisca vitripennis]|uniref:uncharacterized protein LOC124356985 isoform X2 n=1 Tax=Homalodisca vitripennis TaxID=197043 RepID=UPI001EEC0E5E|nr:uncharacterized protein LOC124356985 isoform X2 [Homalodisca vitripennis]XP_046664294.1 uncharacterized protein LOC124356985 isoform X2 [Homalodisca vitripennis]
MPRRSGSNIGRRTRKAQMIFNRRRLNRPVEEHSTDNVEEHPTDTVEEHPRDNVEEHSTDHKEEYSTDSVEEHSTDNVEEHSTDNVNLRDQVRANFKRWLEEHYVSVGEEISSQLDYKSMSTSMWRERRFAMNRTPKSLVDFGTTVEHSKYATTWGKTSETEKYYQGTVVDTNGDSSVVFVSPTFAEMLGQCSEILMDATFRGVPRENPPCNHLLTVFAVIDTEAHPVFSVIMSKRTREAYDSVMTFFVTKYSALNPSIIVADYDSRIQEAAKAAYPNALVVGAWFHYAFTLNRKARQLGYGNLLKESDSARRLIKHAMAIPFLPPERIWEGYNELLSFAAINKNLDKVMANFLEYLKQVWIDGVGATALSVFRQRSRTNYSQELYQNKLLRKLGAQRQTDIWTLTETLRKQERMYVDKLRANKSSGRPLRMPCVLSNPRVKNAMWAMLDSKNPVREFLAEVSTYGFNGIFNNMYLVYSEEISDEEIDLTPVTVLPLDCEEPFDEEPLTRDLRTKPLFSDVMCSEGSRKRRHPSSNQGGNARGSSPEDRLSQPSTSAAKSIPATATVTSQGAQDVPLFRYVDVNDIKLFADPLAEDRAEKEKEALPILNRDTECGPPQEKQIKLEPKDVEQDISSGVFIKNEVFINDSFIDSSDTFHQEGLATTSRISYSSETVEETSSGIRIPNGQHGEKDIYSRFGEIVADSLRSLKQDHLQEKLEQLIQHEHLRKKLEQLICKAVVEVSIKD